MEKTINNNNRFVTTIVWITIIISYLFILTIIFPVRLFIIETKIVNHLDKEILITPYGRIRNSQTTNIPLEFKSIGIANPFNKNLLLKQNDTLTIYHDNDACYLDGFLIQHNGNAYSVESDKETNEDIIVSSKELTTKASAKLVLLTEKKINNYYKFIFQLLLIAYAPTMTIIKVRKKITQKRTQIP